jgi:quercetin dioxygenase-like cupin family protein
MPVVKNDEMPVEEMYPSVSRRGLIGKQMGAQHITMGEITIQPGGEIPLHKHSIEDCILLREGTGEVHIDGEIVKVKAPMSILVPAGIKHKVVNNGAGQIRIIFAFPSIAVDRQLID